METNALQTRWPDGGEGKWRELAKAFHFEPGLIYLNSGSEGSLPLEMQSILTQAMRRWASSPSQAFFDDVNLNSKQLANRSRMAKFVGADPADLVLTDNTTMGLAMVLLGLPNKGPCEIITTQQDHFSMYSPLSILAERHGVKIIKVSLPIPAKSSEDIVQIFRKAITQNTRAICFSHINYAVGLRMPVREICNLARERNILSLVDGAHALGMLDLNLRELGPDFYAASGHKWLNGPPGTGILYIRDAETNPWGLQPIVSERAMDVGNGLTIADALQARANLNGPAFYTLARTAEFFEGIGKSTIERRILQLSAEVEREAVAHWGQGSVFSPSHQAEAGALCCGLTAFVPSRNYALAYDATRMQQIAQRLVNEFGMWVLCTATPGPDGGRGPQINALRVSTHIYNFPDQIGRLFAVLQDIA